MPQSYQKKMKFRKNTKFFFCEYPIIVNKHPFLKELQPHTVATTPKLKELMGLETVL